VEKSPNKQWKDLLPATYTWAGNINFQYTDEPKSEAHHIIGIQADTTHPSSFEFDAPRLSEVLRKKIKDYCSQLGWKPQAGVFGFSIEKESYILVPLSGLRTTSAQKARQFGTDAANFLRNLQVETLVVCAGKEGNVFDVWDGLVQSYYSLESFKGNAEEKFILPKQIYFLGTQTKPELEKKYKVTVQANCLVRMLCDSPPNWLNSEKFADIAAQIAKDIGIKCDIKGREEIQAMGMGSFASVAKGTSVDPKLITLEIRGRDTSRTVALLGKGLTFDSGGISLKPASGMELMKYDMAGGAAVLGAAFVLGHITPPTNVVCIIGAVENMPFEKASRPGDIVKAMNGKTIEIINTDAEGRLVLIDLLHYAATRFKPEFMIDAATLTGAVIIALGHAGAGLMTNSTALLGHLMNASEKTGEPLWHLPIWPELDKEIKSTVADFKNTTVDSVGGKALSAAAFLKAFVGEVPWAHLDIAGTAWDCKTTGYPQTASSGFGLRVMTQACLDFKGF
jgi:leucyl aminopeptidase